MNKVMLKNNLTLFFQTLPQENTDLDLNYIENFSNLFFRFISEVPGEGLIYPEINTLSVASLNEPIKKIFQQNLSGIATTLLTSQEYSSKIGSALDAIISLLPQVFILSQGEIPRIATFNLTTDIIQLLDPVFTNPLSTSFDLSSAIVEGFIIKLNASTIFNSNSGTTINWITN